MATSDANICPVCKERAFYQTTVVVVFEDTHLHRLGMEERSTYTCAVCGATFLRKVKPEFYQVKTKTPPAWLVRKLSKKEAKYWHMLRVPAKVFDFSEEQGPTLLQPRGR